MPDTSIDRSSKSSALGAAVALALCACSLPDVTLLPRAQEAAGLGGSPIAGTGGAVDRFPPAVADGGTRNEGHEQAGSPAEQNEQEPRAGAGGTSQIEAGSGGAGDGADGGSGVEIPMSGSGGPSSRPDMQPMPDQNPGGDPGGEEPPPEPEDPCNTDNGGCHPDADCTGDPASGAVECECPTGYEGNGVGPDGCRDIDQCAIDNGGCDTSPRAECKNFPGTDVECTCPQGSVGNGVGADGCGDSNECLTDNGGCDTSPLARCVNRANGEQATCECPRGYRGDGLGRSGCVDIDECSTMNNGGCDTWPMAYCNNTDGGRTCSCPQGYQGDGIGGGGCYDIDECATDNNGCDASAICTNTEGSFTCSCPEGTALSEDDGECYRFFFDSSFVWDHRNSVTWQRIVPNYYVGCTARYDEDGQPGDVCEFFEASQYCSSLELDGNPNWRMPSQAELESLVYDARWGEPKTDNVSFPDTPARHFWSSEQYDSSNAWYVDFEYGERGYEPFIKGHYVRCVTDWRN